MREIKFRAWDGERLRGVNSIGWVDGELDWIDTPKYNGPIDEDVKIMQYTGLKDKNGVEIYEGDILENGNGKVGYIVFLIQEAGFVVVLKDRDYRLGHRNTGEGYNMAENHKVVGNVYTSPELLEEKS